MKLAFIRHFPHRKIYGILSCTIEDEMDNDFDLTKGLDATEALALVPRATSAGGPGTQANKDMGKGWASLDEAFTKAKGVAVRLYRMKAIR